jgi:lipopolysaccharide/colanic/teichoic acid biosynthesis glycosyltransferase
MSLSMTPPPGDSGLGQPAADSFVPTADAAELAVALPADGHAALRAAILRAGERGLDIALSAILLLLLAPVMAVVAVLVRLDSPGPALFRCERLGHRGRRLDVLKFRKMVSGAKGAPLTTAQDERFTRLGGWLAKYKFDELPQIWQVLKGEMSLVGPRPESLDFVERYSDDYHDHILTVRPGIFGLSQLAFACENRILDPDDPIGHYVARILPQKVALDRMYAAKHSPWLNLRILFWSCVTVVLRRPVAVNRHSAAMKIRRRKAEG